MPHDHPDHDHPHGPPSTDDADAVDRVELRPTPAYPLPALSAHDRLTAVQAPSKPASSAPLTRGAGRGKILFLDAFSGIAGDMLLGALLDLGVPEQPLRDALSTVEIDGYDLHISRREHGAINGTSIDVRARPQPSRSYAAIRTLIARASALGDGARLLAERAFEVLAHAEAKVHGCAVDDVHFHEVGAVDSIVDILGAAFALDFIGATVIASPLPMGRGFIRSAHGPLPLPAPATLECLAGVPTYDAGIDAELVTPTGACLVRAAAHSFARWPKLTPLRVGFGAGTRVLLDRPNVLRVVLGEPAPDDRPEAQATHHVLELNVDDLTGELAAATLQAAFDAGALDAWSTNIGMKKGRPGLMLCALASTERSSAVAQAMLRESSSLGLRIRDVRRVERPRRSISVATDFGPIAVKIASGDGLPEHAAPEFEDCRRAAETHSIPIRQAYAAALAAYWTRRTSSK